MKEKKKVEKPKPVLTIIGFKNKPRWITNLPCVCNGQNDFKNCRHCKYKDCEDSVPREPFTQKDDKGKEILITQITIDRGSDDEVRGWYF